MSALRIAVVTVLSVAGIAAGSAFASTTVHVTLSDKGAAADMPTGLGMGMTGGDMSKAPMMIHAEISAVKAGDVEFDVVNMSKDEVHEMLVIPVPTSGQLPYLASDEAVDEGKAGSLGEVEELAPGKSGTLTLNLKPGNYVLLCNVPGHFTAGMWTSLTVQP